MVEPKSAGPSSGIGDRAVGSVRVAVVVVTWNRKQAVSDVIAALSRQRMETTALDVLVIDNASTDGTLELLRERWRPERIVRNRTHHAHEPAFEIEAMASAVNPDASNLAGFRSLTVIRNQDNMGGCGGFNTGFAAVEKVITPLFGEPDYVWLVDDDVDLPPTALEQLVRTGESDASIGLVGSRTVDFHDRNTTIETTIFFDAPSGTMAPDPAPGHRRHGEHQRWVATVGGTRGALPFTGLRDVDVVSACSLLARWSAVKTVGFWDKRFFIYCDDADWSLRFARAGHRVVCDLDAVVYHTNWLFKLTPTRAYYSQRNLLWMLQKAMGRGERRKMLTRRLGWLLLEARKALMHCRMTHAEILRRAASDVVSGRPGKLDVEEPKHQPLVDALDQAGAMRKDAEVVVFCTREGTIEQAEALRHALIDNMKSQPTGTEAPRWTYVCRDHVLEAWKSRGGVDGARQASTTPVRFVSFAPRAMSKLSTQARWLLNPPTATVVLDNYNEFPMVRSRRNIHVDQRKAGTAQLERDGLLVRTGFVARWLWTAARCGLYAMRAPGYQRQDRYG